MKSKKWALNPPLIIYIGYWRSVNRCDVRSGGHMFLLIFNFDSDLFGSLGRTCLFWYDGYRCSGLIFRRENVKENIRIQSSTTSKGDPFHSSLTFKWSNLFKYLMISLNKYPNSICRLGPLTSKEIVHQALRYIIFPSCFKF